MGDCLLVSRDIGIDRMERVYFLTGGPGVGKTTIIKEVIARVGSSAGGFYTEEIRTKGVREGFRIVTLNGESAVLAHINIHSPYRVSKYGVDIKALDEVAVSALRRAIRASDLVVIDEVGKMEIFSPSFREAVIEAIDSGKRVLGTIMLGPHPWVDEIKRHPLVSLIVVTRMNQQAVLEKVLGWLKS